MSITGKTKINLIIGDPVEHSLSPLMHNAGYRADGIDSDFVFVASRVPTNSLIKAVEAVKILGIRGLTCTMPHKTAVMPLLDEIDHTARMIGAVNTVVQENGSLHGYNTDWKGIRDPLLKRMQKFQGKKVGLIGAGGAARAMAYAVLQGGAKLYIYNRTQESAELLRTDFYSIAQDEIVVHTLDELDSLHTCDIVLNATSIGMDEDRSPVAAHLLHKHQVVFDAVYQPYMTRLLRDATSAGASIIHGTEMLLYQALPQYELYTGRKAPYEVMKKVLYDALSVPLTL